MGDPRATRGGSRNTCPVCSCYNTEELDQLEGFAVARTRICKDCGTKWVPPASPRLYFWVLPVGALVGAVGIYSVWDLIARLFGPPPGSLGEAAVGGALVGYRGVFLGVFCFIVSAAMIREGWKILAGKSGRVIYRGSQSAQR